MASSLSLNFFKSWSGRAAHLLDKIWVHGMCKIINNRFQIFYRIWLDSKHMVHSVTPEKKSSGFRSGEFGGQGISVLLDIRRPLNFFWRKSRFSFVVWQVAQSCMNYTWYLVATPFKQGQIFSRSKSWYTCWSIDPSIQNGPINFPRNKPVQHIAFCWDCDLDSMNSWGFTGAHCLWMLLLGPCFNIKYFSSDHTTLSRKEPISSLKSWLSLVVG